jgi:hypothetical protein
MEKLESQLSFSTSAEPDSEQSIPSSQDESNRNMIEYLKDELNRL